ncbi:MAG: NAD-dependent epimerase/dehydratase family protein [Bacteroidales bacterium]|nr:NAD-dependent epimerase/dehydratase family protein [Bacteroidales bacterium]
MRTALFIGGTGTISAAITRFVATDATWQLYVLNRGNRGSVLPQNVRTIQADINEVEAVRAGIAGLRFDCVVDFIGMRPEHVERDFQLFRHCTSQYIYISSASAYNKPVRNYIIDEGTSLANPYWEYSRQKIACEELLMKHYREDGFPITIVRPSHTYDERKLPVGVHGKHGSWQVARRMLAGKPVIVQGDGTSLWTLTHNTDFARAFVGLMGNPHALGEAFQITSDESLTWNQIYHIIADSLGVELKAYHVASEFLAAVSDYDYRGGLLGDKANTVVFDNTKLKRVVPGFQATVKAADGLRNTVSHILSHPECQLEDPEFDEWCDRVVATLEQAKSVLQK